MRSLELSPSHRCLICRICHLSGHRGTLMHRVGFVTFAGFGAMGLAGLSPFETANLTNGERVYEITLLSETGGPVPCSTGFSVLTEPFNDTVFDTLIVGATPHLDDPMLGVVAFIRQSLK